MGLDLKNSTEEECVPAEPALSLALPELDQDPALLDLEYLQTLPIDELYRIIHAELDKKDVVSRLGGHIAFKIALVAGWIGAVVQSNVMRGANYQEINAAIMDAEGLFLKALEFLGVNVAVDSELPPEEFAKKPHLFLANHQGGGLETNLLAELLRKAGVKNFRYVMKDDNVNLPVIGQTIASRNPILVSRKNLKEDRDGEIMRVAIEIVETLADCESVLFFFEGTRGKNGLIAHTENRQKWCADLSNAIEKVAKRHPKLDYGKVLVVLDTLSVLPVAVEKDPLGTIRTNGDCTATMVRADGLSPEENLEDGHDKKTISGLARTILQKKLIERCGRKSA
jgi:hypothetical protein